MIKIVYLKIFVFLCCISTASQCLAYKETTHAYLTDQAYLRSVLNPAVDDRFISELGFEALDVSIPFGEYYYDVSSSQVLQEKSKNEKEFMPEVKYDLEIRGWLMRGSIREDDLWPLPPRVIHHFYDPVRKIPLTNPFIPFTKVRSPDWGMGSADVFAQPNTPDANRDNHYSFFDAREAMYRALTGQASDGTTDIGPNNTPALENVRMAYWATAFRALGNVLHLAQDAGQSQNTRNDEYVISKNRKYL